jgi:hypothetical protein
VEESSGGIAPLFQLHRTRFASEDLFIEEENRRLESSCRLAKSREPLDLGEGARLLAPRYRKNHLPGVSVNRGRWCQGLHARRDREVRSPDLIGTVDPSADRWHESGASGFRHSGFPAARTLESRAREPRNPEADVAAWGPEYSVEYRWREADRSRFGTRGFDM